MNNRNQNQRTPSPAPTQLSALASTTLTHLNVFTVEEYERDGKTQKKWTKIGAAFPHKEGPGFSIELKAINHPLSGPSRGPFFVAVKEAISIDHATFARRGNC